MRLKYVGGSGVRIVGRYRWTKNNEYTTNVPDRMGAELLTQPRREFEIAPDDPQRVAGMSEEEILEKAVTKIK